MIFSIEHINNRIYKYSKHSIYMLQRFSNSAYSKNIGRKETTNLSLYQIISNVLPVSLS